MRNLVDGTWWVSGIVKTFLRHLEFTQKKCHWDEIAILQVRRILERFAYDPAPPWETAFQNTNIHLDLRVKIGKEGESRLEKSIFEEYHITLPFAIRFALMLLCIAICN